MVNPGDMTLRVEIGRVERFSSMLRMYLSIKGDGKGVLFLVAEDSDGESGEEQSVYIGLDLEAYNQLRRLIRKADETIKELSGNGRLLALE